MTSSSLGIKILFLQRETEISLCEYLLGGSGLRILPVGKQRRPAGCWPRVSAVGQLEGFLQPWTKGKKPNTEAESVWCMKRHFSPFLSFSALNAKQKQKQNSGQMPQNSNSQSVLTWSPESWLLHFCTE